MRAETLTLKELFQKEVRYVVPQFQRPYVWNQLDQWEPLWDDVQAVAERYLAALERLSGDKAKAEKETPKHFMGAVVVQQRQTAARDIDTRDVIDGQQRLTTLQVLLDAVQEVFEELGFEEEAVALERLVINSFADHENRYKLWPSGIDQEAFIAAMTNGASRDEIGDTKLVGAHDFFRAAARAWLQPPHEADGEEVDRAHGLETALYGLLNLVVIDLGPEDDSYVIFETLNARGTPLLASDLVKNYTLQQVERNSAGVSEFHDAFWAPLADAWWRADIRQGRITRPRVDVVLNYWVSMVAGKEVASHRVFASFKTMAEEQGADTSGLIKDFAGVADTYRKLDARDPLTTVGTFVYRWRTMDAGSTTPLVLWLLATSDDNISPVERERCLMMLESVLVRRMLCRLTAGAYNRASLELLNVLRQAPRDGVSDAFALHFSKLEGEAWRSPSDSELRNAVLSLPLYRLLQRSRLRMVFEAIEDHLRIGIAEEAHVMRTRLQIEHILPRSWEAHWPLPGLGVQTDEAEARNHLLHTMGNLTIVHEGLNPRLSNASWPIKKALVNSNTVLLLNSRLTDAFGEREWTEETIKERGGNLTDLICKIWPDPAS